MGINWNFKLRYVGAILAAAISCAPMYAQDAAPSDAEMATSAPSDKKEGGTPSDGNSKEVYGKHVERVKNIRSIFAKLKTQVESMEQVQQAPQVALAPDLPPEALETSDDPAPAPDELSVLDEAPKKAAPKKDKKGAKKPKAEEPAIAEADDEREPAQSGRGMGTYTVKAGDTLGKIAAKTLGSSKKASTIAKANGMGVGEALKVGKSLIIPGGAMTTDSAVGDIAVAGAEKKVAKKEKKERKPKNPASEPVLDYSNYDFKMYVVKPGDSLSKIAKAFYESGNGAELIRKYNKLGGAAGKETPLKSGEKILIPLPKQKASDERYEKARKGIF